VGANAVFQEAYSMRTLAFVPVLTVLLTGAAAAKDCTIENATETDVGPNKGVAGTCSNTGEPIECSYTIDGTVSCTGPHGTYSGDNLDALIPSACGCGS